VGLEAPITENEMWDAVSKGAPRKSSGVDGIPVEFCKWSWWVIKENLMSVYNKMFTDRLITSVYSEEHSKAGDKLPPNYFTHH
jgi:hypothetical protein